MNEELAVDKPNSVFSAKAEEAVISLMRPTRYAGPFRGHKRATWSVTYMVLHLAGFVASRTLSDSGSRGGPPSSLTARWSLTPPFHLFLGVIEDAGMCIFCDTFRFRRIWPSEPSIHHPFNEEETVAISALEAPCPVVFGLSSPGSLTDPEATA